MRFYRPGDGKLFEQVWCDSDTFVPRPPGLFDDKFPPAVRDHLPKRMMFLCDPVGKPIGTITAWRYRRQDFRWGLIHYVAILPGFQGQGLSKPMMTVAMNRLAALGHRRALLHTESVRLPAIRLYQQFGFKPDMTFSAAREAWTQIRREIKALGGD